MQVKLHIWVTVNIAEHQVYMGMVVHLCSLGGKQIKLCMQDIVSIT
jgi:hypothetical protein